MLRHPLLYFILVILLLGTLPASAQHTIRVSGTILQPDKKTPVAGAGIIKVGTNKGVVSDAKGQFLIDIQQQDTLLIRAIGYKPLLYLPKKLPVSEIRTTIVLQEDSVLLGEVEITSRPSEEMIQRAIRNMKRSETSQVKNPGYIPGSEPPPPPPPTPATMLSPMTMLYEMLSKEGKQRQKLQELYLQQELERRKKERDNYNRFFKDNRGY
ncbi:carboxypeptidase-like regulatory domain-containing protein [Pontibacter vulgaris]|uniref:carboxypeptidase-like regulatory domain-containing protein n=1 Tax=Pontibacter vulgaris TaxID=2905679 RepID=UPI001FA7149F|nr:carboxypeptidase-like regulatory domain-containing protein [Pontibacter vulgaris]